MNHNKQETIHFIFYDFQSSSFTPASSIKAVEHRGTTQCENTICIVCCQTIYKQKTSFNSKANYVTTINQSLPQQFQDSNQERHLPNLHTLTDRPKSQKCHTLSSELYSKACLDELPSNKKNEED